MERVLRALCDSWRATVPRRKRAFKRKSFKSLGHCHRLEIAFLPRGQNHNPCELNWYGFSEGVLPQESSRKLYHPVLSSDPLGFPSERIQKPTSWGRNGSTPSLLLFSPSRSSKDWEAIVSPGKKRLKSVPGSLSFGGNRQNISTIHKISEW